MDQVYEAVQIWPLGLPGDLCIPPNAQGLVLFAHGSDSSHPSLRNQQVAELLQRHALATLLFNLLKPREVQDRCYDFDIALMTGRVRQGLAWACALQSAAELAAGWFRSHLPRAA